LFWGLGFFFFVFFFFFFFFLCFVVFFVFFFFFFFFFLCGFFLLVRPAQTPAFFSRQTFFLPKASMRVTNGAVAVFLTN